MRTPWPRSGELVISMTIAEIFLLLLFTAWYATAEPPPNGPPTIALLKAEIAKLKEENKALNAKIAELEKRLEFARQLIGARDTTPQAMGEAFGDKISAAKRGSPKCVAENTIAEIQAVRGTVAVKLKIRDKDAADYFSGAGVAVRDGHILESENEINKLLGAVTKYYSSHSECRFDYRLIYSTPEDFHDAKLRFEWYFYPAGQERVP